MTINYIHWSGPWGPGFRVWGVSNHILATIVPRSVLARSGSTCKDPSYELTSNPCIPQLGSKINRMHLSYSLHGVRWNKRRQVQRDWESYPTSKSIFLKRRQEKTKGVWEAYQNRRLEQFFGITIFPSIKNTSSLRRYSNFDGKNFFFVKQWI